MLAPGPVRLVRVALLAPVIAGAFGVGAAAITHDAPFRPLCVAAGWAHHVALVIEHGDGQAIRVCIGFEAGSISGEDVLRASSVRFATASYGSLGDAVCQVDGEPSTYPPGCFTSSGQYWAVFVSRAGSAWSAAAHGISSETFSDGDAEGFRFDPQTASPPPPVSAAGTCVPSVGASAAVSSAATASATASSLSASATPPPSSAASPPTPPASASAPGPSSTSPAGVAGATPIQRTGTPVPPLGNGGLVAASVAGGALLALLATLLLRAQRSQ